MFNKIIINITNDIDDSTCVPSKHRKKSLYIIQYIIILTNVTINNDVLSYDIHKSFKYKDEGINNSHILPLYTEHILLQYIYKK